MGVSCFLLSASFTDHKPFKVSLWLFHVFYFQLALRTVNSSRSAYGCFMFSPTFFQHYDDGSGQIRTDDSEDDPVRCKVAMKVITLDYLI